MKKNLVFLTIFVTMLLLLIKIIPVCFSLSKYGSTGGEVKEIQKRLKEWGYYSGNIDGIYGSKTYNAVKNFQKKNNLNVDGIVGEKTLNALGISGSKNNTGNNTNNSDLNLLSRLVYGEARGEPYSGQVAVAAVISGTTYSNASSADEKILETIKGMWTLISEYRNPLGTSQNITGQTLDPLYRYVSNEKVYTVGAYEFADKFNAIYADNGYYQFAVTKASSRTAYEYKTSTKTQKPSLYIYEQYQLDSDDRDITINCSSQITTYYKPAMNRVGGTDVTNKAILTASSTVFPTILTPFAL